MNFDEFWSQNTAVHYQVNTQKTLRNISIDIWCNGVLGPWSLQGKCSHQGVISASAWFCSRQAPRTHILVEPEITRVKFCSNQLDSLKHKNSTFALLLLNWHDKCSSLHRFVCVTVCIWCFRVLIVKSIPLWRCSLCPLEAILLSRLQNFLYHLVIYSPKICIKETQPWFKSTRFSLEANFGGKLGAWR